VTFNEFVLPSTLCRIDTQEADQVFWVLGNIRRNLPIWNPQSRPLGLAAENNRFLARAGSFLIIAPPHSQVHLDIAASPFGLLLEVVGEMLRVFPKMAMNVDQHEL
jgi:hypothetical protein